MSSSSNSNESIRQRTALSDTGNDGIDSVNREGESNVSFGEHRNFDGDSDASGDGQSVHELSSDFDAGLSEWESDDQDEDGGEWRHPGGRRNTVNRRGDGPRLHRSRRQHELRLPADWSRQDLARAYVDTLRANTQTGAVRATTQTGTARANTQTRRQTTPDANVNVGEPEVYIGNPGDYVDAADLEALLAHLAETDVQRRVPPPASVSFVKNLPQILIKKYHHEQLDGLACAVCKDSIDVGAVVNRLPCCHMYHPCCILPWLSTSNSCPVCRYELPTDDWEYERRKQGSRLSSGNAFQQRHMINADTIPDREDGRTGWSFLAAAAPIIGIVGIVLVFWLGNPLAGRRRPSDGPQIDVEVQHSGNFSSSENSRSRRWWSLF